MAVLQVEFCIYRAKPNGRLASQHFSLGKESGQTPCRGISDNGCGFRDVSVLRTARNTDDYRYTKRLCHYIAQADNLHAMPMVAMCIQRHYQ